MKSLRVTNPWQQGARLSWGDDLFQQVERVPAPSPRPALPQPEVGEADLHAFHAAQLRQELRPGRDGDEALLARRNAREEGA